MEHIILTPDQLRQYVEILDEFERYRYLSQAEKEKIVTGIMTRPYLDLRVDWAFKHVLRDLDILKMLLNDFLPAEIEKVENLPNEIDRIRADDKNIIMDVLCTTRDGREFICEMQRKSQLSFKNRMFYYAASMAHSQLKANDRYEELRPVYVICFMDFILKHLTDQLVYRYTLCEQSSGEEYGNQLSIYLCELPRLKASSIEGLSPVESWFFILKNMSNFAGKPEEIGQRYAAIAAAARTSLLVDKEPLQYMRAMITEEEKLDIGGAYFQDGYEKGMEKGREEGKAEGRKEGIEEVARALLEMGMPIEKVSSATRLSPEEVQTLR